jgi:hypothetical protein
MATPQGNFTAYQQLKPTELKVGDIYNKAIDELIKNNQAQQAAALKQKMQQNQSLDKLIYDIGDSFKGGIKTTSAMASFASDYTKQTGDRYGQLMYNASLTTDPAEKQRYLQEALRLKNGYEALKASMQSMDYDNIANNDNKNLTDGKVWAGDDKIYVRTLFGSGALKPTIGEDGNYYVAVPKGANAKPDDPAEMVPIIDFFSRYYGKGLEVDITQDTIIDAVKKGEKARDSSKNTRIINKNGVVSFNQSLSEENLNTILDEYFPMKEEDFNVKNVNRAMYQLFYNKTGKYMENFDDYKATRETLKKYIKDGVREVSEHKLQQNNIVNNHTTVLTGDQIGGNASSTGGTGSYIYLGDGKYREIASDFMYKTMSQNGNEAGQHSAGLAIAYGRNPETGKNEYFYYRLHLSKDGITNTYEKVTKDVYTSELPALLRNKKVNIGKLTRQNEINAFKLYKTNGIKYNGDTNNAFKQKRDYPSVSGKSKGGGGDL